MAGNNRERGRSVASKIFAILRALAEEGGSATPAQVTRRCGLPASTVLRLLAEMETYDIVVREQSGAFEISSAFWRMGLRAPQIDDLRRAADPFLHELHAGTGENVNLAMRDRSGGALVICKISGVRSRRVHGETGGYMPAHATAAGKVLLAAAPPDEVDDLLSRPLARFTPFTVTNPALLRRQLADIRAKGFAQVGEEYNLGSIGFAAPIRVDGDVVAAISVVAHYLVGGRDDLRRQLLRTARLIERALAARS